ncbi:ABC transporter substrate-binding protein [Streptomyces sp. ISID311]|uniref:ABC transporter substrate-binding protein n=1 Tax=Streptomyces sp. ISID311 TaxID=2601673 RepID=UPI0011BD312F|nr:ABC transporter substrate-binding protein [Streptomyces sp. ISID311]TXC99831.1 ABC transporter substrate-binding protein [Streptomyces sp. ISID311]
MPHRPAFPSPSVTRRNVLALIGLGTVAAAAPSLTGCTSGEATVPTVTGSPTGEARRGGTARLAFAGAGAAESLDPTVGTSPCDLARYSVVFDTLFFFADGEAKPALATAAEVDSKAEHCTLTLRQGVKWHDGMPFTAADVVHTLKYRASPDRIAPSELSAYFDLASAEASDDHTVVVPTVQPVGDPATLFAGAGLYVIKKGTSSFSANSTVGTGPYRLTAFKAGVETRLERHDAYWDSNGYAEKVVLLSVDDAQARVNAVKDGQADYASDISFTTAKAGPPGAGLQIRDAGKDLRTTYGFVLNVSRDLPSDPRVRRAIKLGIDREALVKAVFLGYGEPANDLFGAGAKHYLDDVAVPERDVAKAKRLLKQAGATGKPFVVRTAEYETGLNSSAELFVEQLRSLGLNASLAKVSTTEGYDPAGMKTCDAISFPLGPVSLALTYTRSAAFETLAFPDEELKQAVATAISTTSDRERADAWTKAQRVMAARGNWVAWGRGDVLSLAKEKLTGIENRESPKYPWLGKVGFTA